MGVHGGLRAFPTTYEKPFSLRNWQFLIKQKWVYILETRKVSPEKIGIKCVKSYVQPKATQNDFYKINMNTKYDPARSLHD